MSLTSIKTRIFLAVAVLLAVIAGLVMTASRQAVNSAMIQSEERAIDNTLALIEANIQGRYRTLLKDKVRTVQTRKEGLHDFDQVVSETLDQFAGMADDGLVSDAQARQLALSWLSDVQPVMGDYVFAFDADNRAVVYPDADLRGADLTTFTDVKGRSVVKAAREEALSYGSTYLTYEWKKQGSDVLVPKYGHFIPYRRWDWIIASVGDVGEVRTQVNLQLSQLIDELTRTLPDITMGGDGFVFLFDSDGAFVVPPAGDQQQDVAPEVIRRLAALAHDTTPATGRGILTFTGSDGDTMEGRATYIRALDWYVATVSSRDAMRAPAEALLTQQAILFAGALAGGLLLAYLFAHRIGEPLTRLAGYAKALSETDFTAEAPKRVTAKDLPVNRRDEVGRLAEAFIFMQTSLYTNVRSLMNATAAREKIEGELNVARDIQLGLLPKLVPAFPGRPEIELASALVSAKEVGGDLYDYYFLDDEHLCFTIGDVAGKGVPAALFMAISKTLIKAAAEKGAEPATMLDKINNDLSQDNPNSIFVTLFVGILNVRSGDIHYVNAGHNPAAIMRNDGSVEILRARSGPAAGIMDGLEYTPLRTQVAPGETFVLYTDGVTEAMNHANVLYGDDRLFNLLEETSNAVGAETIVKRIMADVRSHAGDAEQSDDITILTLRFIGPAGQDNAEIMDRNSKDILAKS